MLFPPTAVAYDKVRELDATFIGTPNYMGVAFFWNREYRHSLRAASHAVRRRIHRSFLRAGLSLDGYSVEHDAIVRAAIPNAC